MAMVMAWVAISLVAAAFVLQQLFVVNLEREVRADLEAAMTRLVALADFVVPVPILTTPMADPRYETPLGGRYWQIENLATGELVRSRSLWDMTIPAEREPGDGLRHFDGPDHWHLLYLSRKITVGDNAFRVVLAEDHDPVHQAATVFRWDMAQLFILLGILIVAAAWLQLRLGLAPLNRLREAVDTVRKGQASRLADGFPAEVMPVVEEVNSLLAERDATTERARRRASDLAHGLKTPLAALHGIALRVRDKGNASDADLIDDLAFEMSKRVDYQMRLASLRSRSAEHRESASLNTAVIRTLTVLKKTGRGEDLHWMADLREDCDVDINRQDLLELVGVTLENATKWAASKIVIHTVPGRDTVQLQIEDDGPGVPTERLGQLGQRGQRLDESTPGDGLGLAIAGEILALNGGTIDFGKADAGGLAVTLTLPLSSR
jgi:signal transduction histidine kinase